MNNPAALRPWQTWLGRAFGRGAAEPADIAKGFRTEIEGMRAVAMWAILMDHCRVPGIHGGFVGPDMFFVISGYLITGIMLRDIEAERFSLVRFYKRRVVRLFPALFAALIGTTVIAFFAMTPNELVAYSRSLASAVFFASNFYFYATTGYFDAAADALPLLHTWSLAVEEQFYIFWPCLILLIARGGRRAVAWGLAGLIAVSLAFGAWQVSTDMSAAFYLLPARAWEFGIGALLAVLPIEQRLSFRAKQLTGLAGAALLLACFAFYSQPMAYPALTAVPPSLATVLLIAAGPRTLTGRALSLPWVRFLGRISYSQYLWHWPMIVFSGLLLFQPQSPAVILVQIGLTILLGWLSYEVFEEGGRKLFAPVTGRRLALATVTATVLVGALALAIVASDGWASRFRPEQRQIAQVLDRDEERNFRRGTCFVVRAQDRFQPDSCLEAAGDKPTVLLIGDSLAGHLWPGLERNAQRYAVLQATMVGCPPNVYEGALDRPCSVFFHDMLTRWVPENRPDLVLLAGSYAGPQFLPDLERTLAYLKRIGQPTVLVGTMPSYAMTLPRILFFRGETGAAQALSPTPFALNGQLRALAGKYGAAYISQTELVCPGGPAHCRTRSASGLPLYFDNIHLTHEGSAEIVGEMMPVIDAAMARALALRAGTPPPHQAQPASGAPAARPVPRRESLSRAGDGAAGLR